MIHIKNKIILPVTLSLTLFACSSNKQVTSQNNKPDIKPVYIDNYDAAINQQKTKLNGKELTNELIWYSGTFRGKSVSGVRSMNDGKHFTRLAYEGSAINIDKYAYATYEKIGTLVSSSDIKDENGQVIEINDYSFSADEKKLLISTKTEAIYRHSSKSYFYIYDIASKKTTPLTDNKLGKQRQAEFSPNGQLVGFVRNNNLFFKNLETNKEYAITQDGEMNKIINGATDWVYEEEFSFHKGFYWNENGTKIAYYRFDESKVKEFQITYYGTLYPNQYKFKYPKAGEANSEVTINIYDIGAQQSKRCYLPNENDIYIPRIKWTKNPEVLTITKLNRLQNKLDIIKVDCKPKTTIPHSLNGEILYTESAKTYIDVTDNMTFLKDGRFLWTSEKSGYNHIYLIDNKGTATQITKGEWEVTAVKGIDEARNLIYYISTEDGYNQRQLYSIKLDGSDKKKLSTKRGFNRPDFSKSFDYYINYHSDANTPSYITLNKNNGEVIKVLEDNAKLKETVKSFDFQPKEFFSFNTSENVTLNGWKITPPNFDENKKYPVFMTCYNGPGINLVNDSWGGATMYWHQLLAQKGYIVVCVDGRGTGYRGRDFKHITYLQLGKYETMDQIETAKYMGKQPYVDASRIGIQGWSYGGYMASLCMTKGADVFKAGIAVAPVTNWRFYDNIYTERFMQTPQKNAKGYDDNSPINHVEKLKGKYLLVHGGGDDNVHPQNTMEMITALVNANKQFDLFYYPNKNHGIYGGTTRMHLFNKMTSFLEENL